MCIWQRRYLITAGNLVPYLALEPVWALPPIVLQLWLADILALPLPACPSFR
ncbi:MAG: hypothetical protein H6667_05005 [Ardenticatenaceae bacterium]|nr:hypothetical protein [Ardenticatenaceae bacterium]